MKTISVALFVLLAACAVSHVAAILQLCDANANPAAPKNFKVASQKWDDAKKGVEVKVQWDNPTTEKTGCIVQYTFSFKDDKGTELGSKRNLETVTTSPITITYILKPSTKYTANFVEHETAKAKKARLTLGSSFTTMAAPTPKPCDPNAAPVAPTKVRVDSQKWNNGKVEVVFAWDNPTTSSTGCITKYTWSYVDAKGTSLGGMAGLSSPTTNPIKAPTSYLNPSTQYTLRYIEHQTAAGKKARTSPNLTFITQGPPPSKPVPL